MSCQLRLQRFMLGDINPLAFFEVFIVLAFAIGWCVLEWVANRIGSSSREEAKAAQRETDDGAPPSSG